MSELFAEWYSLANPAANDDIVKRRWQAVTQIAEALDPSSTFQLARAYYGVPRAAEDMATILVEPIREADAAFVSAGHDFELAVIAGAALFQSFSTGQSPLGDLSALSIVVPAIGGARGRAPLPALLDAAEQYLVDRSSRLRETKPASPLVQRVGKDSIEALAKALTESQMPAAAAEMKKILSTQNEVASCLSQRIVELEGRLELFREESDILWWLTALHSRIANQAYSSTEIGAASLLMGRDLADLTRIVPGPLAISAFIERAIIASFGTSATSTDVSLAAAINGLPAALRLSLGTAMESNSAIDLCPVSSGILSSNAVDGPSEWFPSYRKAHGIDPETRVGPVGLGRQVYLECLFLRSGR